MKKFAKNMKRAFTITELVIVIAVIAILAAVLIPTFSSVINSAKESAAMQECHNALTNLSARLEQNGQSTVGMALKNEDYLYVNLNGSLHLLENVDGNACFTHSEAAVVAKDDKGWLSSTKFSETKLEGTYVNGFANASYDATEGMTITITNATENGGGTSKPLTVKLESNENLYLYTITDNGTTYLGYFSLEMNDAKNTENNGTVVFSTRYGYVALGTGANITFASASAKKA